MKAATVDTPGRRLPQLKRRYRVLVRLCLICVVSALAATLTLDHARTVLGSFATRPALPLIALYLLVFAGHGARTRAYVIFTMSTALALIVGIAIWLSDYPHFLPAFGVTVTTLVVLNASVAWVIGNIGTRLISPSWRVHATMIAVVALTLAGLADRGNEKTIGERITTTMIKHRLLVARIGNEVLQQAHANPRRSTSVDVAAVMSGIYPASRSQFEHAFGGRIRVAQGRDRYVIVYDDIDDRTACRTIAQRGYHDWIGFRLASVNGTAVGYEPQTARRQFLESACDRRPEGARLEFAATRTSIEASRRAIERHLESTEDRLPEHIAIDP